MQRKCASRWQSGATARRPRAGGSAAGRRRGWSRGAPRWGGAGRRRRAVVVLQPGRVHAVPAGHQPPSSARLTASGPATLSGPATSPAASSSTAAARSVTSTGQRISSVNRVARPASASRQSWICLLPSPRISEVRTSSRARVDRPHRRLGRRLRRPVRVHRRGRLVVEVRLGPAGVQRVAGQVHQPRAHLGGGERHVGRPVGGDRPVVEAVRGADHGVGAYPGHQRAHRGPVGHVEPARRDARHRDGGPE